MFQKGVPPFSLLLVYLLLTFGILDAGCGNELVGWIDRTPTAINSLAHPGEVNPNANSGGRRIVRLNDVSIALAPELTGEKTYRSADNGVTWQQIDSSPSFSGTLVSGPSGYVYHFFLADDEIWMVKFRYYESPPLPAVIFSRPGLSETGTGLYRAVNATVDSKGRLYVAAHWGLIDVLYLLRSDDAGAHWEGPFQISVGTGPWFYPHLEVNQDDELFCVYADFSNTQLVFAKSLTLGKTWARAVLSNRDSLSNPAILTAGNAEIFVFAQSSGPGMSGLVFNHSHDKGQTWAGWALIDPTCGYADPSPALGSDGAIYVAYRSSNGTRIVEGTCGDRCRERIAMSTDKGLTWTFPDNHYNAERTGTRSQTRYQTWFNYGGPLEWIWMQYENGGTQRPIYYDLNVYVQIFNTTNP